MDAGTLYRRERDAIVSSVGCKKCKVSGGDCIGFSAASSSPLFSETRLLFLLIVVGGVYGGGAGAATSPAFLLPPLRALVAKSYEGGSRRPEGRGFDGEVAIWQ